VNDCEPLLDGHTPLMCAAQRGATKAAKALLEGVGGGAVYKLNPVAR
jgi:ankyrin repeat protein